MKDKPVEETTGRGWDPFTLLFDRMENSREKTILSHEQRHERSLRKAKTIIDWIHKWNRNYERVMEEISVTPFFEAESLISHDYRLVFIKVLREESSMIRLLPDFMRDRLLAHLSIEGDGNNIRYLPSEMKRDPKFIMNAIRQDPFSLQYTPLRFDRGFLLESMLIFNERAQSLTFTLPSATSRDYLIKVVRSCTVEEDGNISDGAISRRIVSLIVERLGLLLEHASSAVRNCKEVVEAAVRQNGHSFQYASLELRNDRDFLQRMISLDGKVYRYASDRLRGDRELAMSAITKDPGVFDSIPSPLRHDKDLVFLAVYKRCNVFAVMSFDNVSRELSERLQHI